MRTAAAGCQFRWLKTRKGVPIKSLWLSKQDKTGTIEVYLMYAKQPTLNVQIRPMCSFLSFCVCASAEFSLYSWGLPQNQVNGVAYDLHAIEW